MSFFSKLLETVVGDNSLDDMLSPGSTRRADNARQRQHAAADAVLGEGLEGTRSGSAAKEKETARVPLRQGQKAAVVRETLSQTQAPPLRRRDTLPAPISSPNVAYKQYVVGVSDTLAGIAVRHGVSVQEIERINRNRVSVNMIHPGMVIYVPGTIYATSKDSKDESTSQYQTSPVRNQSKSPVRRANASNHSNHGSGSGTPTELIMRENALFCTSQYQVRGQLTVTSRVLVFEPNLDDPFVQETGSVPYQVFESMSRVVNCRIHETLDSTVIGGAVTMRAGSWSYLEVALSAARVETDTISSNEPQQRQSEDGLGIMNIVSNVSSFISEIAGAAPSSEHSVNIGRCVYFGVPKNRVRKLDQHIRRWSLAPETTSGQTRINRSRSFDRPATFTIRLPPPPIATTTGTASSTRDSVTYTDSHAGAGNSQGGEGVAVSGSGAVRRERRHSDAHARHVLEISGEGDGEGRVLFRERLADLRRSVQDLSLSTVKAKDEKESESEKEKGRVKSKIKTRGRSGSSKANPSVSGSARSRREPPLPGKASRRGKGRGKKSEKNEKEEDQYRHRRAQSSDSRVMVVRHRKGEHDAVSGSGSSRNSIEIERTLSIDGGSGGEGEGLRSSSAPPVHPRMIVSTGDGKGEEVRGVRGVEMEESAASVDNGDVVDYTRITLPQHQPQPHDTDEVNTNTNVSAGVNIDGFAKPKIMGHVPMEDTGWMKSVDVDLEIDLDMSEGEGDYDEDGSDYSDFDEEEWEHVPRLSRPVARQGQGRGDRYSTPVKMIDYKEKPALSMDDLFKLREVLPQRYHQSNWKLLYSTVEHGISLQTFYMRCFESAPTCIVVTDSDGFCFGAFVSDPWRARYNPTHYGSGESFLFTVRPAFNVFKWTRKNNYFQLSGKSFLSIGGGGEGYGLWLDNEFHRGSSRQCETFSNTVLSARPDFEIVRVEAWLLKAYKIGH